MDAPTQEEKEKILHWLISGMTHEKNSFLQSVDRIRWKYLDDEASKQQPTNNNDNEIEHQSSNSNSIQADNFLNFATNQEKKILNSNRRKRVHPCNYKDGQSQRKTDDDESIERTISKTRESKRLKDRIANEGKSKQEVLIRKDAPNLNLIKNHVESNAAEKLQLLPAVVHINANLSKVKIETDYVPAVEIKSEPGTGIDGESLVAVEEEPIPKKKSEPKSFSDEIPSHERAFQTDKILTTICSYVSSKDLLFNCSLVSKQWNKISRQLLQQDRTVYANLDQLYPCRDLIALSNLIEASSIYSLKVPYNGLSFIEKNKMPNMNTLHKNCRCVCSSGNNCVKNSAILSCVQMKYLHLNGTILTTSNQYCLAFNIIKQILEDQGTSLVGIKLQSFLSTGAGKDSEYRTCTRKFSEVFPVLGKENRILVNVKEVEIIQKGVYDSRKNNAYIKILQSQLHDLLNFTPNLEVIKGLIPIEFLEVVCARRKIPCVKDLKAFLYCDFNDEATHFLKLNNLQQAISSGLRLKNLEIETCNDINACPLHLAESASVTSLLFNESCSNLKSLSIGHRDFARIFGKNTICTISSLLQVEHLSVLNYDSSFDPDGTLTARAVEFEQIFPKLRSVFLDLKNQPALPLLAYTCNEIPCRILNYERCPFNPCLSVLDIQLDTAMKGILETLSTSKIIAGLRDSFPNVRKCVCADANGNFEDFKELFEMLLCRIFDWKHLEVLRLINVAPWGMKGNLDFLMRTISNRNVGESLKKLEIKIGKHCQNVCSKEKSFLKNGQLLVSKEVAQLVERVAGFSVEIDSGICTGGKNCYYALPSHYENLPGFLKCVTSFQD